MLDIPEEPIQTAKQGQRLLHTKKVCIRGADGNTKYLLGISEDITERKQSESLQSAIYKISEISVASENLLELYAGIHMVIDELMNTANFYIALYNQKDELLEFPYFVDEKDARPASRPLKKGLTEYVLRTGSSLMAPPLMQKKLVEAGEIEMVGAPSIDWVGVPLKSGRDTFGAIVVQSYREQVRFGARELSMLNFVSDNIAAAIQRKKGEDERKKLVAELQESLSNIKTLKGLVPICSSCKKIRNDGGYWQQVEEYVAEHTEADFSHGICDECAHKLYPQYFKDKKNKTKGDEVG
jgi:transcriptional regulator with GAF, ATPase, and Fis domain